MIIITLQTDATRVVSYRQPVCDLLSGIKTDSFSHSTGIVPELPG